MRTPFFCEASEMVCGLLWRQRKSLSFSDFQQSKNQSWTLFCCSPSLCRKLCYSVQWCNQSIHFSWVSLEVCFFVFFFPFPWSAVSHSESVRECRKAVVESAVGNASREEFEGEPVFLCNAEIRAPRQPLVEPRRVRGPPLTWNCDHTVWVIGWQESTLIDGSALFARPACFWVLWRRRWFWGGLDLRVLAPLIL